MNLNDLIFQVNVAILNDEEHTPAHRLSIEGLPKSAYYDDEGERLMDPLDSDYVVLQGKGYRFKVINSKARLVKFLDQLVKAHKASKREPSHLQSVSTQVKRLGGKCDRAAAQNRINKDPSIQFLAC